MPDTSLLNSEVLEMITVGIPDLRHRFTPELDTVDDLTLVPMFHVAFTAFLHELRLPADQYGIHRKSANVAAIEGAVLARNYKAGFEGSIADVLRKRFLAFLKKCSLEELKEGVRCNLSGIATELFTVETGWFYFGIGECILERPHLSLCAS